MTADAFQSFAERSKVPNNDHSSTDTRICHPVSQAMC